MEHRSNVNLSLFIKLTATYKMNEKRSQEYQSMDPEYVTGQINSRILELLLRRFCCLIVVSKILICFSLIKLFPNDHKRYCSVDTASSGSYKSLLNNI